MPGSTIGQVFRVTTAGESHGPAILAIIDGCPAGLEIDRSDLVAELQKRRPGQSPLASSRNEEDEPEILSGIYEGRSTGAPIAILIRNRNSRSEDYEALVSTYRPGHADWSHEAKYGIRDPRGGGRASARETAARVCAGAIAKKLLRTCFGTEIVAYTMRVGPIEAPPIDIDQLTREAIERLPSGEPNWMRCPHPESSLKMAACVEAARAEGDSLGGVAEILARNVPPGLGEPVFDKLKADLAKALFSIPAVTGLEFGSGFRAASMRGSEHNDPIQNPPSEGAPLRSPTNHHGGILGGISTGMPIIMRAALKPPSSIARPQPSVDRNGNPILVETKGRHDPCVVPRFLPIAEAMVAIVLADHALRARLARLK